MPGEGRRGRSRRRPRRAAVKGEGIVVGHPDTGYTRHAEIFETPPRVRVADSFDFVLRTPDAVDPLEAGNPGHGTTTASVIMSATGGAGAHVRVGRRPGGDDRAAAGHAARRAARLRPARGGHPLRHRPGLPRHLDEPRRRRRRRGALERAIAYAVGEGVVVLAAAGNVWPWVVYPARYDQVIACAACNCQRAVWSKSASGDTVDVTAPGESVWVARPGKDAGHGRRHRRRRFGHVVCRGDDGGRVRAVAGVSRPRRADHPLRRGPAGRGLQGSADDAGRRHAARLAAPTGMAPASSTSRSCCGAPLPRRRRPSAAACARRWRRGSANDVDRFLPYFPDVDRPSRAAGAGAAAGDHRSRAAPGTGRDR